jgi:AcrR family transcriptional regulator
LRSFEKLCQGGKWNLGTQNEPVAKIDRAERALRSHAQDELSPSGAQPKPSPRTKPRAAGSSPPPSEGRFSGQDIISFTESINNGFSAEFANDQKRNSVRKLLVAAVENFAAKGFHGTTTRDIARAAGMSPAALYVHFPSKRDLLFKLTIAMATAMLEDLRRAQATETDPARQLRALVWSYARCNARMHTAVHVATYEFDVLSPEQQHAIVELRHQVNSIFIGSLLAGRANGQFAFADEHVVRVMIMSMCVSVATWFSAAGALSAEQLGDQYGNMVVKMVAAGG